jgi:hypothetical protein
VRKYGFVFWKEISLEETIEKCFINVDKKLETEEEVLEICQEQY